MTQISLKILLGLAVILTGVFFENISRANPQQDIYNKAFKFFIEGKPHAAIQTYLEALKIKPDSAETHHYLGVLYFESGSGTKAIDHFKKAELFYKNRKDKKSKFNLKIVRNNLKKAYKKLDLNPDDFRIDILAPAKRGWESSGVGFFIGKQGNLLTTSSSIMGANKIRVRFPNGRTEPVKLIQKFIVYKIAILKLENPHTELPKPLVFEDTPHFKEGNTVYAMDFLKLQAPNPSLSKGEILKKNALENSNKVVQLDLEVQKGQYGGPLFNSDGNVIGLILGKPLAQKSFSYLKDAPANASFAIKSSYLKTILSRLVNPKKQNNNIPSNVNSNSGINVNSVSKESINNFIFLETFN